MDYFDFELEIGPGSDGRYPVTVLNAPGGESARATMVFPFDRLALENQLQSLQIALLRSSSPRRRALSAPERSVEQFGRSMFDALMTDDVRVRYAVSRRIADGEGKGLRLKLRISDPALASLPWEYLYDPDEGDFVALSERTPLIRYLELPKPPRPLEVKPPLRILGMVSDPSDLEQLDVAAEKQRVERALQGLRARGLAELTWLEGQTWRDLLRAMRHGPWHIFYFIGHGGFDAAQDEGVIALANDEGRAEHLGATSLGRVLDDHFSLRLVVLNSCEGAQGSKTDVFSSTAATLIRCGIPAVLAMQHEISDDAAIEFARTFYDAIGDGAPIDAAVADARLAISIGLHGSVEWGTPVLHMRAPDGVLFRFDRQAAPAPPPVAADEPAAVKPGGDVRPQLSRPKEPIADPPPQPVRPVVQVPFDPAKRQVADLYLDRVRGRLRHAGFAIREGIVSGSYTFDCVARASGVSPPGVRVGPRETVVIIEHFGTVDPASLGAFARVAAAWAETTRVSGSFGTLFCAPVALVDALDPVVAPEIVNDRPLVFRRPPAANLVLPVVYDLATQSFYSPLGSSTLDQVIWPGFRTMVQQLVSIPPRPDHLPPAGASPVARLAAQPPPQRPQEPPPERKTPPKPPDLPP